MSGHGAARLVALAVTSLVVGQTGCILPRYLAQAAHGQVELLGKARPMEDVVADPETPLRTALLLAEIPEIKQYGRSYGLKIKRNYNAYADLGRRAAVWFVGAADPVAFKPLKWCFPIVGCFAGLGWFDEDDGVKHKLELEAMGYDALVRPASAYSTGGWFPDPVLSTMLGGGNTALPALANVILHESVHATVLVPDQPFFNESLASYVADAMTDQWIVERFGRGSPEEVAWTLGEAIGVHRTTRVSLTYKQLKAVYESAIPREQKLARKAELIDELVADLRLNRRPNNASLTESRVYNGGADALLVAHRACGDLRSMVEAAKTLVRADFGTSLQDDLTPIGVLLGQRCQRIARAGT